MSTSTKVGHGLAKFLRIKLDAPESDVTRGESVFSIGTAETFVEEQPTSAEWLKELAPSRKDVISYFRSLFPFLHWIGFYNVQWLLGDLVAGITVGAVVVPQGMAYAKLANLPVQFGLYSSFMGVLLYWFFATSKDITIGPVAVMSTVTGNIITHVITQLPQYTDTPWEVAECLAIILGAIVFFIGIIRCGWIVEIIPLVSLASFMTGSAINIAAGQVPTMMGITGFSTRDATYKVIINTLKNLGDTQLDAAMGLTALLMLYAIRSTCSYCAKKYPKHQRLIFFIQTLRTAFVILLYTMISWLVNMHIRENPKFKILGTVPRGFTHAGVPTCNSTIIKAFASDLPAAVIVLLIEHIAISKSFGRVNNYRINPSQEMVAIGVTNLLGPFLGAYPSTGSFSRTAIKSKAGVRTPMGGVITAVVVLLAIYALTSVFFYIPSASLAAVIIHAVGDLITPPNTLYRFWRVNPWEVLIWFVGVLVTVFSTIEDGIYTTICLSFAVFLFRVLRSNGRFLGRVHVHSLYGDMMNDNEYSSTGFGTGNNNGNGNYGTFNGIEPEVSPASRNVFLPIGHEDGSNPELLVTNPYPGIFIYRFTEGFNYPNASYSLEYLVNHIFKYTRRTKLDRYERLGDRPWNDPGVRKSKQPQEDERHANLPTLKAIIIDFSSVNNVDVTSVQQLIDVRNQLDHYVQPDVVDWHFACINNRWAKRALVSAGFGYPTERADGVQRRWRSIFSIAEIGGDSSPAAQAEIEANEKEASLKQTDLDIERGEAGRNSGSGKSVAKEETPGFSPQATTRRITIQGLNRPLFHVDLTSALQSAITNAEARNEVVTPTNRPPPPQQQQHEQPAPPAEV